MPPTSCTYVLPTVSSLVAVGISSTHGDEIVCYISRAGFVVAITRRIVARLSDAINSVGRCRSTRKRRIARRPISGVGRPSTAFRTAVHDGRSARMLSTLFREYANEPRLYRCESITDCREGSRCHVDMMLVASTATRRSHLGVRYLRVDCRDRATAGIARAGSFIQEQLTPGSGGRSLAGDRG